jgi:predicted ATPase
LQSHCFYKEYCYILTGGPGAGKTSVLDALQQRGHLIMPEVAREIIREEMAVDGQALPWRDKLLYKQLMADRTIEAFHAAPAAACFFDRGIADVIAYSRLIGAPEDNRLMEAAHDLRYNQRVFIFPPWKEIYATDTERKQDFKEAVHTFHVIKETYTELGYELIEMPFVTVADRADLILDICARH